MGMHGVKRALPCASPGSSAGAASCSADRTPLRKDREKISHKFMETPTSLPAPHAPTEPERLAYSVQEAADLLGVDYFSVYRLIQRGKLRACRALRGKLLVPRTELLRLLKA